jgi:TRAP transporter TAXI family solute receptor
MIADIIRIPSAVRRLAAGAAVLALTCGVAGAQAVGIAAMQPGSLNHTTASAIAKVAKEKANINALVQPTAGESVIIPIVGRGEAEIGIANALEVLVATEGGKLPQLRLIGAIHPLATAYFVRKDSTMRTIADLKGKRITAGFSAQKTLEISGKALLLTGGVGDKDFTPVLVPNVVRGADDFVSGSADAFFFAFGAPKVREVDATVGGIRALEVPEAGMAAAGKLFSDAYLLPAQPGPFYIGVEKPQGVYTWDNMLFTNASVKDDVVYKLIEAMAKNKDDLVQVQPALRPFTPEGLYKKNRVPYHPGALKYFADNKIAIK